VLVKFLKPGRTAPPPTLAKPETVAKH